ncbi:LysR family transcriptional regulator [Pseudonocardia spinosispora]|uniref:LysR family transcriptional regulator n=1 Tax=Pseudonocardia spinosispora TaxID=103441 RepID=UPI00040ACEA7|nr:LysR family transcriptional regulator [Pseudonocardia spinosispora]
MELDAARLRVLVEVAHAGSIAEAARRLSFTPSALSQQIAKLEKELDTRLLERRATGVRPTPVGAILVEHGERVLGELRAADAAVRAAREDLPQRLALGAFATAGKVLVPAALAALEQRYPRAELSLLDLEPPDGYGLVTSGDLDALITHRYPGVAPVPHPGLDRSLLLGDPLRVALPAGHRLRDAGEIDLARLQTDSWISGAVGVASRTALRTLTRALSIEPRVAYETADYHVTLALVGAGLGVALVPASMLGDVDLRRVSIHRLRGRTPVREVSIVHRRRPPALVQELVSLLRASADDVSRAAERL